MLLPPIISILMRAGTVTNDDQNRANAEAADLVMSPPLGDIDIRDWRAFDRAVDIGYRYALGVLEREGERLLTPHRPQ
jgi:NTE family protein